MNNFFIVLKALFKNKFRFGTETSDGKKALLICLFAFSYLVVLFFVLFTTVFMGGFLAQKGFATSFYLLLLLTGAGIVLIFGIIFLVNTLYISKDTDFFSMLPIKSSVVFAAKLAYVYICEAVLVVGILLPAVIVFGIVAHAWAWYYLISVATLAVVPALPLALAAIIAVPIMFIAGKMKNRNIVSLIFYVILFLSFFGLYAYIMIAVNNIGDANFDTEKILSATRTIGYVLYPYSSLANAAFGVSVFGLGASASAAVEFFIFVGISAALFAILLLLGKFMYSQSAKANNQTYYGGKAKKGEFKSAGSVKALIKREYMCAMRTTQTTFQCFIVYFLPILFAVVFGFVFRNMFDGLEEGGVTGSPLFLFAVLAIMMSMLCNASITSFSREGSALASLKVMPISIGRIVKSKALAWISLAIPSAVVCAVIASVFDFSIVNLILSILAYSGLAVVYVIFGVLWDLISPKLKWTDPVQAVKHNTHATLGQFICMAGGFLCVIIASVCMALQFISPVISTALFWITLFADVVIFAVIDIVLYGRIGIYYDRIEI